jgi:murein DD-endopeptidase MepM/ murein hydrolase activator NlpD
MDTRRHAPVGRRRIRFAPEGSRGRSTQNTGRSHRRLGDIYASDHADSRRGGRFRWLFSTCLAAAVGVLAILVVIAGSTDTRQADGGLLPGGPDRAPPPAFPPPPSRPDGLRWAIPKADRLVIPTGAVATMSHIPDRVRQRRGNRDYIVNRLYVRLAARLGPVPKSEAQRVPPFNPLKLYANTAPVGEADRPDDDAANVKILELLSGVLPAEDGQELSPEEIAELVARAQSTEDEPGKPKSGEGQETLSPGELLAERSAKGAPELAAPNTSIFAKSHYETEDAPDDSEGREVKVVRAQRGDTLARVLSRLGAEAWQAKAMSDAARNALPDGTLSPGQEVQVTLVPSVVRANRLEPIRVSVFGEGQEHKVTVTRNAAGEFVASASPIDERVARADLSDNVAQSSSLYASVYNTAVRQNVSPDVILQIFKIHAYETDFRQRVRAGDSFEFFFDMREDDKGAEGSIGELLATSITSSGETRKFYRYRTPDGGVDYYDEQGNTSRKFLMRRPVRGDDVRLTSGFGMRRHPALQILRMHPGEDWACAPGTPIMAAGSGVIEEAGRKGEYGNYVRIRHANGYKTAYGHMMRIAPGAGPGVKVRQGQIIGYVGSTGLSTGPHVHFEVLVNNAHVDPKTTLHSPRDRQLDGKQLADFQKERLRIDDLMRRNPVSTKVATLESGGVR